jgi:hypothetical protein
MCQNKPYNVLDVRTVRRRSLLLRIIERLLEPTPVEAFRQAEPEEYEELMRQPGFLCIRAVKH